MPCKNAGSEPNYLRLPALRSRERPVVIPVSSPGATFPLMKYIKCFCHTRGLADYFRNSQYPSDLDNEVESIAAKLRRASLAMLVFRLRGISRLRHERFPSLVHLSVEELEAYQSIYDAHVRVKVIRQALFISRNCANTYLVSHSNQGIPFGLPGSNIPRITKSLGSSGFYRNLMINNRSNRYADIGSKEILFRDGLVNTNNFNLDGVWQTFTPVMVKLTLYPTQHLGNLGISVMIPANWDTCDWRGNVLLRCVIREILRAQQPASSEPRHA